jgi:hypothetical protein
MTLEIDDPETDRLAEELATLTGARRRPRPSARR